GGVEGGGGGGARGGCGGSLRKGGHNGAPPAARSRRGGAPRPPPAHRRSRKTGARRSRRTAPARPPAAPSWHGRSASRAWPSKARAGGAMSPTTLPARQRQARRMPVSCWPIPSNHALPERSYGTMTLRAQILRVLAQEDL